MKENQDNKENKKEPPHAPGAGGDKQHPQPNEIESYPLDKDERERKK